MTRIFGYHTETVGHEHIPFGVLNMLANLQEALVVTCAKNWQAYGLGFIVVNNDGAKAYSVYKGYQGIPAETDITSILPDDIQSAFSRNPNAVFGVLQNEPDQGRQAFEEDHQDVWKFPLESENWLAITMGLWGNEEFTDTNLVWYDRNRPSLSIVKYLESKPQEINFNWVDPKRIPFIIAVSKNGNKIIVDDRYSGSDPRGFVYKKENYHGIQLLQGVRSGNKQV